MKEWKTILGGQFLDPKYHTEQECLRFRFITENIGSTSNVYEQYRTARALRIAKAEGFYPEALEWAKCKRSHWRDYVTMTQRKWQANTHRPSRARHHDSLATREKYVRCLS